MTRSTSAPLGLPGSRSDGSGIEPTARRATGFDRRLARALSRATGAPLGFRLWDGETIDAEGAERVVGRVRVHDRRSLWKLALDPDLTFGDLYSQGRIEIEGDLLEVLEAVYRGASERGRLGGVRMAIQRARAAAPSVTRSRRNIHHHYDLGNRFYRLWLDRDAMQYTCAYYPRRELTLEHAQRAKMELVCRKLWLRPGERVVEAGCGWGGFALHMARSWGVKVRAFNISREQIAWARERAAREGLGDRVEYVEDDYRNIDGRYDAFVSIGMLEHVGRGHYAELGRLIGRCLAPGGRGLIHTIGRDRPRPLNPWIRKRIFPGSYPPSLGEMAAIFEPAGLSVLDVENLRLHYAETLRAWLSRYEAHFGEVRRLFDERFARAWRLYLAGSLCAFRTGSLQLFQVLFGRSGANAIPWTRDRLHTEPPRSGKPP